MSDDVSPYLTREPRSELDVLRAFAGELARELERWTREYCNTPARTARLLTRARALGLTGSET